MPVEFLSDEQAARYGRYASDPMPAQLTQYFLLTDADLVLLADRRRKHNKLGMAVQLCTLRFLGTFPPPAERVPTIVVHHVAQQLGLPPDLLHKYGQREATRSKHRALLLTHLGYQEFGDWVAIRLIRWLYAQLALSDQRPSVLFDLATAHLAGQKIVLPGVTVLARLIARVRNRFAARTFGDLSARLSAEQEQALQSLLVLREDQWKTPLEVLRTPPTRISAPALDHALHRIEQIRAVGVHGVDLGDLSESRRLMLVRHARVVRVQLLARMGEDRRLAILLVFLQHLERSATDDALDVFEALMTKLTLTGLGRRKKERLRTLIDTGISWNPSVDVAGQCTGHAARPSQASPSRWRLSGHRSFPTHSA